MEFHFFWVIFQTPNFSESNYGEGFPAVVQSVKRRRFALLQTKKKKKTKNPAPLHSFGRLQLVKITLFWLTVGAYN